MINMESMLVTQDFIDQSNTYNLIPGGACPDNPRDYDYYKSGDHIDNANKARTLATEKLKQLKTERVKKYNNDPTLCAQCKKPLIYEKKRNKFCGSSCAATFNNTGRVISESHKTQLSVTAKSKRTVTDDQLIEALTGAINISGALIKVNLRKTKNNYHWANELIVKHNLTNIVPNLSKKQKDNIQLKVTILLNSDIDFSKHGWVKQAARILSISGNKAGIWVKNHMPDFYEENCYKRKTKNA